MNSVDSFTINPTRDFFDWMELWFKNKGIEINDIIKRNRRTEK
jgi:hypothetical protein